MRRLVAILLLTSCGSADRAERYLGGDAVCQAQRSLVICIKDSQLWTCVAGRHNVKCLPGRLTPVEVEPR